MICTPFGKGAAAYFWGNEQCWGHAQFYFDGFLAVIAFLYSHVSKQIAEAENDELKVAIQSTLLPMIQSLLQGLRMALPNENSFDHDLKITLFVPDENRQKLRAILRAGGDPARPCRHIWNIHDSQCGIAGLAYNSSNAAVAFELPDLNDPELKGPRKVSAINEYARRTRANKGWVKTELEGKKGRGRRMPRALYGLRVWEPQHQTLGVVVIDTAAASIPTDLEKVVETICDILVHPLIRLEYDVK